MRSKLFAMSKVVKSCCNIDFAVLLIDSYILLSSWKSLIPKSLSIDVSMRKAMQCISLSEIIIKSPDTTNLIFPGKSSR